MGLKKEIDLDNSGVVLSYWHIAQVVQRFDQQQVEVTLHPYVSEAAYKANMRPAGPAVRYTLVADDFPSETDLRTLNSTILYQAVKAKASAAAKLPRDGNVARFPELAGIPTDPALADAEDIGVG